MNVDCIFKNGEKIPEKFTADGENINPEFIISALPKKTKSLILVVDDPDAQRVVGHTWIHWIVFDIPVVGDCIIKENSLPGVAGESTYRKKNYGGPSPPKGSGIHHYHFKFYAIDIFLNLSEMTTLDKIKEKAKGHILDESEIVGIYSRD
jgi:Raf kinase inhibitor-like YbhB/YbcL family protein